MPLLKLYRFPATVFLIVFLFIYIVVNKAMKAPIAYLVLPASQVNKNSNITYYTLAPKPLSAFALFFHILAYIISSYSAGITASNV